MWRQGDVLIQTASEIPSDAIPRKDLVLAEGELTGHVHQISEPTSAVLFQRGEDLFLSVTAANATLTHDEHGPITLVQGVYRVWRQREYAPEAIRRKKIRYVRD